MRTRESEAVGRSPSDEPEQFGAGALDDDVGVVASLALDSYVMTAAREGAGNGITTSSTRP